MLQNEPAMLPGRSLAELPQHPEWYFQLQGRDAERRVEEGIRFVDPLYGTPLTVGRWPQVLTHDAVSQEGCEYFQTARHPISLVYGFHRNMRHFSDILEAGQQGLAPAKVVGLEVDWQPSYQHALADPEAVKLPNGPRADFVQAELDWARAENKYALPMDIDGPPDALRTSLQQLFYHSQGIAIPFPDGVPEFQRTRLRHDLCRGAYNAMRQPMMWAQLGYGLGQLILRQNIGNRDTVAVVIGSGHDPTFTVWSRVFVRPGPVEVFRASSIPTVVPDPRALALPDMIIGGGATTAQMLK